MTSTADGIKKGRKSQIIGEQHVLGETKSSHDLIDGDKIEVKTSQKWTKIKKEGRRHGRFRLFRAQHEKLLKDGGKYVFVVHDHGEIIGKIKISARRLEREHDIGGKFKITGADAMTLNWNNILTIH